MGLPEVERSAIDDPTVAPDPASPRDPNTDEERSYTARSNAQSAGSPPGADDGKKRAFAVVAGENLSRSLVAETRDQLLQAPNPTHHETGPAPSHEPCE
jgi:hypothetical protein